jgi:mRNA-degrading endonuclease toxin of MazEF toxin-antitoxin module
MRRGEVRWHEPPDDKRRPVLILTRAEAIGSLNKLVAAPATGTIRGLASEVAVGPEDGMLRESVISLDNTTLVRSAAVAASSPLPVRLLEPTPWVLGLTAGQRSTRPRRNPSPATRGDSEQTAQHGSAGPSTAMQVVGEAWNRIVDGPVLRGVDETLLDQRVTLH